MGIVIDTVAPPAWVGDIAAALSSAPYVDLTLVIVAGERARPRPGRLLNLFCGLDRRLFGAQDDPFRPSPSRLPSEAPRVELDDPSFDAIARAASLDVILHLGTGRVPPEVAESTGSEIWWFERGGEPPYLGDLVSGSPVSTTVLMARSMGGDSGAKVLARAVTRAEPGWWHRTCAAAYLESTELAVASLRKRSEGHLSELAPEPGDQCDRSIPRRRLPKLTARAIKRRIDWQRFEEQWLLAVRARRPDAPPPSDMKGFMPILPPPRRSYADPFLATTDAGAKYVFFEDQPHDSRKGVIACARIDADGGLLSEARTVLERDYHLSYPFVFRQDDDWFLLPESAANRTVELYRATDFPTHWELHRVLIEGARVADATPFHHEGRTWFFASTATTAGAPTDAMSLFWADSLVGNWHPHPLNPIVTDVRGARPAGRIISHDGRLFRPAQDGSLGYGCALVFNEILELTPTSYRERPLARFSADWLSASIGTHHYDADSDLEVIDVRRRVRRRSHRPRDAGSPS